ncbi:MAG: PepSY-associated TM helix domain-containing protein [Pseudomonadota bacterium]
MSFVNKDASKRLLAVHGWSGTVLGLFLYVVVLTGAIAVFRHEIGEWSAGGAKSHVALDQPLNARLAEIANQIDPEYLKSAFVFSRDSGEIVTLFSTTERVDGELRQRGVRTVLDPVTLEEVQRDEGYFGDFAPDQKSALERFIVRLHVSLHAPRPWGLWATGILGFVMLSAAISGILLHKNMIRDLFVAPRWSSLLLNRRDRHILAGSWSLPFSFILAFTGTFFSFAGAIGLPIVAIVAFGGDQEKLIREIQGVPATQDSTPAALTNIDTVVAQSTQIVGSKPTAISVRNWGRADALITLRHPAAQGSLNGSLHRFAGPSGDYLGLKPNIGTQPSAGNTAVGLIGPLHFGTFGGLLSKIVWFSLGLATCYITLTGLQLWVQRRAGEAAWAWLPKTVTTVGYGTGVALASAGMGFFTALPFGRAVDATAFGFLAGAAVSILLGAVVSTNERLEKVFAGLLAILLPLLPATRMALAEDGWGTLLATGNAAVVSFDIVMMFAGAFIAYWAFWHKDAAADHAVVVGTPAE